jgi:16S rRNA processing protein RimM
VAAGEALLEVGRIDRSHGLRGEVVVHLLTNRLERLTPGSHLVARTPFGDRELVVVSSRPHGRRHIVLFQALSCRDDSDALHGSVLFAEALPCVDPQELFVHELIGSELVDTDGASHGVVTAVEANPASDLLVVDDKWYVPARFVVSSGEGRVVADVPEGLFE